MFNLLISYHNKFMVNNYKMIKLVNNIGYKIVNIQLIYLLIQIYNNYNNIYNKVKKLNLIVQKLYNK